MDTIRPKLVSYFEGKIISRVLNAMERREVLHMMAEIVLDKISFEEGFSASMFEEVTLFNFSKTFAKKGATWWNLLFQLDCETFCESEVEIAWASLVALPFTR